MIDQSFLDSIFSNLEKKTEVTPSGVLIVDSTNLFIRSYSVSTHINRNGDHIGGLVGFLRSLGYIVRDFKPRKIILVFDGEGNSTNKKYLFPDYKANRGTGRVINYKIHNSKEEEEESMENQMGRLIQYLKQLPVSLVSISNYEADDVIGYLSNKYKQNEDVIVVSTDRDYYQLVEKNVKVYNPRIKMLVDENYIFNEFGVYPHNFLTLKVLIGDTSDNIPGVQGMKEKTTLKLFPEMGTRDVVTLDDIYRLSEERIANNKIYSRLLGFSYQLEINKKIMNIMQPNINSTYEETINESIDYINKIGPHNFRLLADVDRIGDSFHESWVMDSFGYLK